MTKISLLRSGLQVVPSAWWRRGECPRGRRGREDVLQEEAGVQLGSLPGLGEGGVRWRHAHRQRDGLRRPAGRRRWGPAQPSRTGWQTPAFGFLCKFESVDFIDLSFTLRSYRGRDLSLSSHSTQPNETFFFLRFLCVCVLIGEENVCLLSLIAVRGRRCRVAAAHVLISPRWPVSAVRVCVVSSLFSQPFIFHLKWCILSKDSFLRSCKAQPLCGAPTCARCFVPFIMTSARMPIYPRWADSCEYFRDVRTVKVCRQFACLRWMSLGF